MSIGNWFTSKLLQSPFHRLLSGSVDLVRYTGRRSGRQITTPTQYARQDDNVIILVGSPDSKRWWRNFREPRDIELLLRGEWHAMTARAVVGSDEPEAIVPLIEAYLRRHPKAVRTLGDGTSADRVRRAVVVWCRPR